MEEYSNVTIACMKCKKKVAVKDMKYSRNGEDLICMECSNAEKGVKVPGASSGLVRPMASSAKQAQKETSQKVSYECEKCGYKFSRNKGIPINSCPYCNGGPLSKSEQFGFYNV
ncbi:hypothetical protein HYV81_02150 [Candidatus Woesearchaeota archaeon]|nr:hypothetical protein [Candidatus Woesearchaeota archaeon]